MIQKKVQWSTNRIFSIHLIRALGIALGIIVSRPDAQSVTHPLPIGSIETVAQPPNSDLALAARDAAQIRPGQILTGEKYSFALKNLAESDWFSDYHIDTVRNDSTIDLHIRISAAPRIASIKVTGAYPLFEHEITNAMTLHLGSVFDSAALSNESELLVDLLKREGFHEPRVTLLTRPLRRPAQYHLSIQIKSEGSWRIGSVALAGNATPFPVALTSRVWRSQFLPFNRSHFVAGSLNNDTQRFLRIYRRLGFYSATVNAQTAYDTSDQSVIISFAIEKGAHHDVSVKRSGRTWLAGQRIARGRMREQGNSADRSIRWATRTLEELLAERGFLRAKITLSDSTDTTGSTPQRSIAILVNQGMRTRFEKVSLSGAPPDLKKELSKQVLSRKCRPFDEKTIAGDIVGLKGACLSQGYLGAQVEPQIHFNSDSSRATLTYAIEPGIQTLTGSVTMAGIESADSTAAFKRLSTTSGKPWFAPQIRSDENYLSERVSDKGHPFVKVSATSTFSADSSIADVAFAVEPGKDVVMGRVHLGGNLRTRPRAIKRELGLKTGQPFSVRQLLEGQRDVRNQGLFRTVGFSTQGLEEQRDTIHLFVDLEEKRFRYLESSVGAESQQGIVAQCTYGNLNLLGTNRSAWIGAESGNLDIWIPELTQRSTRLVDARLEAGLAQRRLFGTRAAASLDGYAQRHAQEYREFGSYRFGSTLSISRSWTRRVKTAFETNYEWRNPFRLNPPGSGPDTLALGEPARNLLRFSPQFIFDNRNSFIRPLRGGFAAFAININKGLNSRIDDLVIYDLDLKGFRSPTPRLTIAARAHGRYLDPYGAQENLPNTQLLYLGGTQSVRGYGQDLLWNTLTDNGIAAPKTVSTGGNLALSATLELRLTLISSIELSVFADGGEVWRRYPGSSGGESGLRSGAGLGLGYHTPIGPVAIMYALKLGRLNHESPGAFHFSIGYTF